MDANGNADSALWPIWTAVAAVPLLAWLSPRLKRNPTLTLVSYIIAIQPPGSAAFCRSAMSGLVAADALIGRPLRPDWTQRSAHRFQAARAPPLRACPGGCPQGADRNPRLHRLTLGTQTTPRFGHQPFPEFWHTC